MTGRAADKPKAGRSAPIATVEYRVTYSRGTSPHKQVRFYQRRGSALKFIAMIRHGNWRWHSVREIRLDRRDVGPWVEVEE